MASNHAVVQLESAVNGALSELYRVFLSTSTSQRSIGQIRALIPPRTQFSNDRENFAGLHARDGIHLSNLYLAQMFESYPEL